MEAHIRKLNKRARELGYKANDGKYDWLDKDVELFVWEYPGGFGKLESVAWDFQCLLPKTQVFVHTCHPYVNTENFKCIAQMVSRYNRGDFAAYWWGQESAPLMSQGHGFHSVVIPADVW